LTAPRFQGWIPVSDILDVDDMIMDHSAYQENLPFIYKQLRAIHPTFLRRLTEKGWVVLLTKEPLGVNAGTYRLNPLTNRIVINGYHLGFKSRMLTGLKSKLARKLTMAQPEAMSAEDAGEPLDVQEKLKLKTALLQGLAAAADRALGPPTRKFLIFPATKRISDEPEFQRLVDEQNSRHYPDHYAQAFILAMADMLAGKKELVAPPLRAYLEKAVLNFAAAS
jgi:hypothetical protein